MSKARDEGHDAFVKMLTTYVIPTNPYSPLLAKSHKTWSHGFWDAMYTWRNTLGPADICKIAKFLNEEKKDGQ